MYIFPICSLEMRKREKFAKRNSAVFCVIEVTRSVSIFVRKMNLAERWMADLLPSSNNPYNFRKGLQQLILVPICTDGLGWLNSLLHVLFKNVIRGSTDVG
jgi:hypothetical protein